MKQFLKHISVCATALLVLFSTFSFTINEHICGGEKVSFAIGIEAETCGMEVETSASEHTTVQQTPCCSDISTLIQGLDELPSQDTFVNTTQTFITAFVYSYIYILSEEDTEKAVYTPYKPPPLVKDIQVLDETFLI
ncbi:hypothetical protein H2O64_20715 [Kordia sp. YSTF-M3]|uniref:Secreted protein n=1 Tax=Kordia aestuariivivens TaxID=2759037 RepID=A0ABR7QF34_9FLAO|nr:hypothetical protein [Kordia aestuariivivens]MBC8757108.1 hypothetical protein [Kordia aestuariivivens]